MQPKTLALLSITIIALTVGAVLLRASAPPPRAKVELSELPLADFQPAVAAPAIASGPQALARLRGEAEHSFGELDVGQTGSHEFLVRNDGQAPLTLRVEETSCKCTQCDVGDGVIEPGHEQSIRLEWKTAEPVEIFRHGAYVATNDPANPRLRLTVIGRVRSELAVSPNNLVFTDLTQHAAGKASLLVYSQAWDDFEIVQITTKLAGLSWELRPASAPALANVKALSGYEIEVAAGPGLPTGRFSGQLALQIASPTNGVAEHKTLTVDVAGSVLPNVTLFGPGLDLSGWRVGTLLHGDGAVKKLSLTVRGEQREVQVLESRAEPSFVKLRFEKESATSAATRYKIVIEVPESAPPGTYRGEILLRIDHPERPEIRLPVSFSVATPAAGGR